MTDRATYKRNSFYILFRSDFQRFSHGTNQYSFSLRELTASRGLGLAPQPIRRLSFVSLREFVCDRQQPMVQAFAPQEPVRPPARPTTGKRGRGRPPRGQRTLAARVALADARDVQLCICCASSVHGDEETEVGGARMIGGSTWARLQLSDMTKVPAPTGLVCRCALHYKCAVRTFAENTDRCPGCRKQVRAVLRVRCHRIVEAYDVLEAQQARRRAALASIRRLARHSEETVLEGGSDEEWRTELRRADGTAADATSAAAGVQAPEPP